MDATRLNVQALAEAGAVLDESISLHKLERLATESIDEKAEHTINWQAKFELRDDAGRQASGQPGGQVSEQSAVWLHLHANASIALTCQRCLTAVLTPLAVTQWYRFVGNEAIAMAEDDASDEDLLVMTPQFDLLAVLEDELLMALPLVPMHDVCPAPLALPVFGASDTAFAEPADEKPHPFAALAGLKNLSKKPK